MMSTVFTLQVLRVAFSALYVHQVLGAHLESVECARQKASMQGGDMSVISAQKHVNLYKDRSQAGPPAHMGLAYY